MTDANTDHGTTGSRRDGDRRTEPLPTGDATSLVESLVENVETVIIGQRESVEHLLTALLGRGHLLLDDVPGVGKTMLVRAVARSVDGDFSRIQFTPDLLPTDVTGVNVFNEKSREFEFRAGPVFGNVVLGDEINRAPPKTQSALLEAMEEEQVTADGETHPLSDPFFVVATQNAVENDHTYDLPVAELDRFTKRLSLGYPDAEDEVEVYRRAVADHPIERVEPVATLEDLRRARATAASVSVATPVREYVARLAEYTREHAALGVSPRGGIALLRSAQGRAVLAGREFVVPDDVQAEAPSVFAHRIRAERGGPVGDAEAERIVDDALASVPVEDVEPVPEADS